MFQDFKIATVISAYPILNYETPPQALITAFKITAFIKL